MSRPDALRRLARNAAVPMLARLVDLGFALVYLRFLQQEGTGAYGFLVVFTAYLDTLLDFGLNALLARDVSRLPDLSRVAFRSVNLVRLGLWLAGLPLVALVYGPGRQLANLPEAAALAGWLFYLALLPSILGKTATGLLWALERLEVPALVAALASLLKAVLGSAALVAGLGLVGLAGSSLVINVLSAGLLVGLLVHVWQPAASGSAAAAIPAAAPLLAAAATPVAAATAAVPAAGLFRAPALLRAAWPLFVNQLLQGLFFKIDSLLLPGLAGLAPAGAYRAAYQVAEGAGVFSSSITLAIFPRLSRRAAASAEELASAYRLVLRFLLQIALPLAAGTALLAEPIVGLLGGRAFLPDAAIALTLLIWYLPFSYANGLAQYVLIAVGRQRFLTVAFLAAFVFNVAANLALIPAFGYLGAAAVTVASELVLLGFFQPAAARSAPGVSLLREARGPLLATLAMVPVVWWLRDAAHPAAAVAGGLAVYPLALWALGGVDDEERRILRDLAPRRPGGRDLGRQPG